jgi:hypothetical protein
MESPSGSLSSQISLWLPHQLRQLGDIHRDQPIGDAGHRSDLQIKLVS